MARNLVSLEVINFAEELKRVEQEVINQGYMQIHTRIDFATETLRQVTPVDTGNARSRWRNNKFNFKFFRGAGAGEIINDAEYIDYLNAGSSKQAPKYFIEQVLSTIGIITPNFT